MPAGFNAVLYQNQNGGADSWANPVWLGGEITRARDVDVSNIYTRIDLPVRNRGKASAPLRGIQRTTLSFEMQYEFLDADMTTLLDAHRNNTPIDLWAADRAVTLPFLKSGWRSEWMIESADHPQPLNGLMVVRFRAVPSGLSANGPVWHQEP